MCSDHETAGVRNRGNDADVRFLRGGQPVGGKDTMLRVIGCYRDGLVECSLKLVHLTPNSPPNLNPPHRVLLSHRETPVLLETAYAVLRTRKESNPTHRGGVFWAARWAKKIREQSMTANLRDSGRWAERVRWKDGDTGSVGSRTKGLDDRWVRNASGLSKWRCQHEAPHHKVAARLC